MKVQLQTLELFHADRRTDSDTEVAKLIEAFLQLFCAKIIDGFNGFDTTVNSLLQKLVK
jgi:hypothetical protein